MTVLVDTLQANPVSVLLSVELTKSIALLLKAVFVCKGWEESMVLVLFVLQELSLPQTAQDVLLADLTNNLSMECVPVNLAMLLTQPKSVPSAPICQTVSFLTVFAQFALEPWFMTAEVAVNVLMAKYFKAMSV